METRHTISEIVGKDIENAVYNNTSLLKNIIEELYPEYDFSIYNVEEKEGNEIIDEFALYNELLKNDPEFRDKVIEYINLYKYTGFAGDDELIDRVWKMSKCIEENLEEVENIKDFEDEGCLVFSQEMMDLSANHSYIKRKQKKRKNNYMKNNK